jgi:alpha-D-xyloside xylohydrolase
MTGRRFGQITIGVAGLIGGIAVLTTLVGAGQSRAFHGVVLPLGDRFVAIEVCTADVIRVVSGTEPSVLDREDVVTAPRQCDRSEFSEQSVDGELRVTTDRLEVRVDEDTGVVRFHDLTGSPILRERERSLEAAKVQGEATWHVRQAWEPNENESLYGLAQQQFGLTDLSGYTFDLWQHNVQVVVPVLVSSRGYGVLWNNTSYTRFGDRPEAGAIPADQLFGRDGSPGGLTGHYFSDLSFGRQVATRLDPVIDIEVPGGTPEPNHHIHPDLPAEGDISVRWEGEILARESGDHQFEVFSNAGIKLWVDGRLVADHWRQGWLPWTDLAKVRLEAGRRYAIRLEWRKDQGIETMQLKWRTPAPKPATALWSEVGDAVDYYFFYGPDLDDVVAGYRRVTGEVPMMPRWAFGLWQSRERYRTAQESLDVLAEFRRRRIPVDTIVQDWQYWEEDKWGSHGFDASRFPDPENWVATLHERYRARLMISVWGKFYPGTANFDALDDGGYLYQRVLDEGIKDWLGHPYTFYDPFSAGGRRLFWEQLERDLFSLGVDAWWMDATEPDISQPMPLMSRQRELAHPTGMGTGARVLNAYSLLNSQAIYEGQRAAAPDQRVFILTRSGFAGQQRYASVTWSGDVTSTWTAFRQQIPAGTGFTMTGIPYWTMDIGGFSVPPRFAGTQSDADEAEWREMNTRWFQFGAFCPIFRSHGQSPPREMWHFGDEGDPAYQSQLFFDRLRYRLLPYVYSLAGAVTHDHDTMMRGLVMDFPEDRRARVVADQYMFGPAFLVSPVTTYRARTRPVYLPSGAGWYDFWTGASVDGGQEIDAAAPYARMPLHVRAGSIVPVGPDLQYTTEQPADPVTLLVYTGADGSFTLYEDDGLSYAYERGELARIPITWNDASNTLTIGARSGSFPGMLESRTFQIVSIAEGRAVGFSFSLDPDTSVTYRGEAVSVELR